MSCKEYEKTSNNKDDSKGKAVSFVFLYLYIPYKTTIYMHLPFPYISITFINIRQQTIRPFLSFHILVWCLLIGMRFDRNEMPTDESFLCYFLIISWLFPPLVRASPSHSFTFHYYHSLDINRAMGISNRSDTTSVLVCFTIVSTCLFLVFCWLETDGWRQTGKIQIQVSSNLIGISV